MSILLQLTFNALVAGSLNALLAAGFSLIYSTNRFVYLAHGAVVTTAAYVLYSFSSLLNIPFGLSIVLTIIFTGLLGWGLYYTLYNPLKRRKTSSTILLIASAGLMFLIMNVLMIGFGASVRSLDVIPIEEGLSFFGANITPLQIVIVGVALFTMVVLWSVMKFTKFGKILRAVADNPELAQTSGINTERIEGLSFLAGSALAAVTGILLGLEQNMTPYMGTHLAVSGYTAAIIGGVASVPGAIFGGYVLGAVENFGIWYLPSGWKEGITFTLLLIFLVARPNGILGINKGARED